MASASKETPLMRQYYALKAEYPEALLLFRVGDFYETFGEDAIKASKALEITLTKRSNGAAADMELAGFPHHSLDTYLPRLVKAGFKVAVCEQLEDPKSVKGIVKRGVTEVVTPGIAHQDSLLPSKSNNYLACFHEEAGEVGLAFLDVSTGEFWVAQSLPAEAVKWMTTFIPPKWSTIAGIEQSSGSNCWAAGRPQVWKTGSFNPSMRRRRFKPNLGAKVSKVSAWRMLPLPW